ncbi:MAG: copper resistance protein B [Alphaproteobacteria bacterium]
MRRALYGIVAAVMTLVALPAAAQEDGTVRHVEDAPLFHRIEVEADYAPKHGGSWTWNLDGWVGGDVERVWLRSEGEAEDGRLEKAEAQLYYGWNVDPFWDALIGLRQDFEPRDETYLAASVVGLAPYFVETEASLFVSLEGDVSLRLEQSLDLSITQRLIAEPHLEANLFAQDVDEIGVGAGLSEIELGLQLRYEIERKFAPYLDAVWSRKLGETASNARAAGGDPEETRLSLGLRVWF